MKRSLEDLSAAKTALTEAIQPLSINGKQKKHKCQAIEVPSFSGTEGMKTNKECSKMTT